MSTLAPDSLAAELYRHLVEAVYAPDHDLGAVWVMNQEWHNECRNLAIELGAYQYANARPMADEYLLGFRVTVRDDGGVPHLEPCPS